MSQTHNEEKLAKITVDDLEVEIPRGIYSLADFKQEIHADATKVVEMFIKGKFETLKDTDTVDVKPGEKFATHVQRGGSSCK